MKIYFAASIRGGRENALIHSNIIKCLSSYGTVLTEHVGTLSLTAVGEVNLSDSEIFLRDMGWMDECDVVIAEVTTPSLGVGYEIGYCLSRRKPILCLFKESSAHKLSAMLAGNSELIVVRYNNLESAFNAIDGFFKK